jgi:hypothetical protein
MSVVATLTQQQALKTTAYLYLLAVHCIEDATQFFKHANGQNS